MTARITKTDINHGLNWSMVGLTFFSYVHLTLLVAWTICGLDLGFSNGILHVPPLGWELIVLKVVTDTVRFNPCIINGQFGADTNAKFSLINFSYFLLLVGLGLNITHGVFTILYDEHTWFYICFTVILFSLAVLDCIYFYYLVKFKQYIQIFKDLNKLD